MLQMLALSALAGSSLLGAVSSWQQGEAANSASKINAERLRQQAMRSRTMTAVNLYRQKRYADEVYGSQVASIAHSGGSIDDPTSQAILKDTALESSIDEWLIKYAGANEYYNTMAEASAMRYQGKAARKAGRTGALATILGGAADTYFAYDRMTA